ncbi:MAG: hypothetical protein ACR2K1_14710 [Saprospiraceae bacterium]
MSDQHELQSLDKLFKKSFDDLPDTPAASGWDQPNPHVWQNLQSAIRPAPAKRWRWQYCAAIVGAIATAVAILYLSNPASKQEEPPAPAPQPGQRVAVSPALPQQEETGSASPTAPSRTLILIETLPVSATSEGMHLEAEKPDIPGAIGLAEQLPGTIPAPPNTTEGLKAELGAVWARPLAPLPAPELPRRVEKRR